MFIRIKDKGNEKKAIQIVKTHRSRGKVSQIILRHVGTSHNSSELLEFKKLAEAIIIQMKEEANPLLPGFNGEEIFGEGRKIFTEDKVRMKDIRKERQLNDGISDIFGSLYDELGFNRCLSGSRKDLHWNQLLKHCVLARVSNPVSKRKTKNLLEKDYNVTVALEKIYRMMDWVDKKNSDIKDMVCQTTQSLFSEKVDVLFFDVTTLYFESIVADDLRCSGFSKDCKFKETQVVLALVTTQQGLPITYELFHGKMSEGDTLITTVNNLKERFNVENILLVADRAMFSEKNLKAMEINKVTYVVAAKLRSLSKVTKNAILESSFYRPTVIEEEFHWVKEFEHKNRRLMVSYSSERAKRDAGQRKRLVDRLVKQVNDGELKIKNLITNHGTKRFIDVKNEKVVLNEAKIESDSAWDGLHGVITNSPDSSIKETLSRYRGLWQIEEAFRINKHDLKMRPIYHWTPKRIRAHIAICFLAYALVKQVIYKLKLKNIHLSFEKVKEALLDVESTIVKDKSSFKKFVIPTVLNPQQNQIYKAFGINYQSTPYSI